MMFALLLHVAQGQTCGPGHLELDWSQARLVNNNLGGHGKVQNGPSLIRFGNIGYLGGRQVDLIIRSRETDSVMRDKCDYGALPPPPTPSLGPHAARHKLTAALV